MGDGVDRSSSMEAPHVGPGLGGDGGGDGVGRPSHGLESRMGDRVLEAETPGSDDRGEGLRTLEQAGDGTTIASHISEGGTVIGAYEDGETTLARRLGKVAIDAADEDGEAHGRLTLRETSVPDHPAGSAAGRRTESRLARHAEQSARASGAETLRLEVPLTGDGTPADAVRRWRARGYEVGAAEDGRTLEVSRDVWAEIPSDLEEASYTDMGREAALAMPASGWREASPEERRLMIQEAWYRLGTVRFDGRFAGGDTPLYIRDRGTYTLEGYQPNGAAYVNLDQTRLADDDPSGVLSDLLRAREFDYQARRMDGRLPPGRTPEEVLEAGRFERDTADFATYAAYGDADDARTFDLNARVSDARAAATNGAREYWHAHALVGGVGVEQRDGEVRITGGEATARGNDRRFDVPREDAELYRAAGDQLAVSIPPGRWRESSLEQRRALAIEAHATIRRAYGLPEPAADSDAGRLRLEDLGAGTLGGLDRRTGVIALNERLLRSNDPDRVLGTLLHENRHAWQRAEIVKDWPRSRWLKADTEYPFAVNEDDPTPDVVEEYAANDLERDARTAEGVGMERYWHRVATQPRA